MWYGMLPSDAIDWGIQPRWRKTEDYKIYICCFSLNHTADNDGVRFVLNQHTWINSPRVDMSLKLEHVILIASQPVFVHTHYNAVNKVVFLSCKYYVHTGMLKEEKSCQLGHF
jgi:hypothetical protein